MENVFSVGPHIGRHSRLYKILLDKNIRKYSTMEKTYFITGAGGWLGGAIVDVLCKNNIDNVKTLRLFDKKFSKFSKDSIDQAAKDGNIRVEYIVGDVTDLKHVEQCTKGVDVIIHSAAIIDIRDEYSKKFVWRVNVEGTENILQCCFINNIQSLVYTSSVVAFGPNKYGHPLNKADESTPYLVEPVTLYAKTKLVCEEKLKAVNGKVLQNGKKFSICMLRPSRLYGGDNDVYFRREVELTRKKKYLYAVSSADKHFSSIHVSNAAWCHVLAAKKLREVADIAGGKSYFIGDDTPSMSIGRFSYFFLKDHGYTISKEPFIPFWLLYFITALMLIIRRFFKLFGKEIEINATPGIITSSTALCTVTHQAFSRDFGYKPIMSWEESQDQMKKFMKTLFKPES